MTLNLRNTKEIPMRSIMLALLILVAPVATLAQTVTPDASQASFQIPVAWQVVGITMQTYTGDMGGSGAFGATRACLSA